jgi:hypothetical protein
MHFTSEPRLDDGLVERHFTLDGILGILWTPEAASTPSPLVLLGHPGGLDGMKPRLTARARRSAEDGFATATIELPGAGDRPRLPELDAARAELRHAVAGGETVEADVIDRLVLPLVEQAVPEWRAALDVLLVLPDITGPVGYSGGIISVGVRLAVVEPRIAAAVLFAGSYIPSAIVDEARLVTIPLHVLLQWDDEGNDRQASLGLFDAFGSRQKSLAANMGGHRGVPAVAGEEAAAFLVRHLM